MSDKWEPCPRCDSKSVQTIGKGTIFLTMFGAGSLFIWIGFLLPFLWVGTLLMPLSIIAFFIKPTNHCKECKYQWKVDKQEASA